MEIRKYCVIAAWALSFLFAGTCLGEDWEPMPYFCFSANEKFFAFVVPADANGPAKSEVFEVKDAGIAKLFADHEDKEWLLGYRDFWGKVPEWQRSKKIKLVWVSILSNDTTPYECFLSNDGSYFVTLDTWEEVGYGDDFLAFYNKDGQIKRYSIYDAFAAGVGSVHYLMGGRLDYPPQGWSAYAIIFLYEGMEKPCLCMWVIRAKQWWVWDLASGKLLSVDKKHQEEINNIARQMCHEWIKGEYGIGKAFGFLYWLKNPQDRDVIKDSLNHESFDVELSSWDLMSKSCNYISAGFWRRGVADEILAKWDGLFEEEDPNSYYEDDQEYIEKEIFGCSYYYLGNVRGVVRMPEKILREDGIWLYLISAGVAENEWWNRKTAYCDGAYFKHELFVDKDLGFEIPFVVGEVTPGRYWIKLIWDRQVPWDDEFDWESYNFVPGVGDYESFGRKVFEVKAGETVDCGVLECSVEIKKEFGMVE
jgi:hypothetical protein